MSKTVTDKVLTAQQQAAIKEQGKLIVSASAGSGKTFVMIERLADYVQSGGDLDDVLAVTFTKKAAAQMKEKLRAALIKRSADCTDGRDRTRLKAQLNKIPSANISTIHSFCAYLLRTHFYLAGIDGSFEILSEDNGAEKQLKARAMEELFDGLYESGDKDFIYVLNCYGKKRSDGSLKAAISRAYDGIRMYADYRTMLLQTQNIYTEQGFNGVCAKLLQIQHDSCAAMRGEVEAFMKDFSIDEKPELFNKIAGEITANLFVAEMREDIFQPLAKFTTTNKISGKSIEAQEASAAFGKMRSRAKDVYDMYKDFTDKEGELQAFLQSGKLAAAFSALLLKFDEEYGGLKREEGKLDYGDLEHLTLKILSDEGVKKEVQSTFKQVFVDEYQDVNPVQESIISAVGGDNLFLVGDVKQAIYGFRGSKSVYFTNKIEEFSKGAGKALSLSSNFRSAPKVISTVNALFCRLMRVDSCGIDYAKDGVMTGGGAYPAGSGGVTLHIFGKEEKAAEEYTGVYSVVGAAAKTQPLTREGLCVIDIVQRELESQVYDLDKNAYRKAKAGDICILTRMNGNDSALGITRALARAGYPVTGAQSVNVCDSAECKQIIDILSYIDNGEQDIPLASALLSLGGLTEGELAQVRLKCGGKVPFRSSVEKYARVYKDDIAAKLNAFYCVTQNARQVADLYGAGTLIDYILGTGDMEARYMRGGGYKLKNIMRLKQEAYTEGGELSLNAFLTRLKIGGYNVPLAQGSGDGIKVMTMHASKGLEFPIVIIADVCRSFKGRESDAVPLDEEYGFVHKYYNNVTRSCTPTILNKLTRAKTAAEEVKNEMNLLYVACTRAKFRLHILAEEEVEFNSFAVNMANDYAHMLDMSVLSKEIFTPAGEPEAEEVTTLIGRPDEEVYKAIKARYQAEYVHKDSVDLPVKSSASALLKSAEGTYFAEHELFPDDEKPYSLQDSTGVTQKNKGKTGAERGTAYHRFLQLCDFGINDISGIERELKSFEEKGLMPKEQIALLQTENLQKILQMPIFKKVCGSEFYREQEFLCSLPANSFLNTSAQDGVLIQGAIDLLCFIKGTADGVNIVNGGNGKNGGNEVSGDNCGNRDNSDNGSGVKCAIIDYKYSVKSDSEIVNTYAAQLKLYALAVQRITGIPRENISLTVINLYTLRQIPIN